MKKILLYLPLGFALSCAKTRPTERVPDINENRFEKSALLAHDTWLAKETIVASDPLGGFGFVGLQSSIVAGKFEFSKDKLRFIRAASYDANEETLDSTIYSWDVDHSEYRLAESGGKVSNRQEENNYIEWFKKRYFKVDFSEADLTLMDTKGEGGCFEMVSKSLVSETQKVATERMTFEVDYTYKLNSACFINYIQRSLSGQNTHKVRVRYSFIPLRQDIGYEPFRYESDTDPLFDKYGFFNTVVEAKSAENRLQNVFLMNRWHPEKEHTFYFAPGFPEEYKWIYNDPKLGVLARTNQLFERNGITMRFRIEDAPEGVAFGDLGHSFVKFVEEVQAGSPLGYGPSDENPFTGELIGANSIIWTSGLKVYVERLKRAEQSFFAREDFNTSDLYSKMSKVLGETQSQEDWKSTSAVLETLRDPTTGQTEFATDSARLFHFLLPKYTYAPYSLYSLPLVEGSAKQTVAKDIVTKLQRFQSMRPLQVNPDIFSSMDPLSFDRDQQAAMSYYQDRFEVESNLDSLVTVTQEVMQIEEARMRQQTAMRIADPTTVHYLDEAELGIGEIDNVRGLSAGQIIDNILYKVAIHEFGHNLNLRHNFMGSVDEKNFNPPSELFDRKGQTLLGKDGKPLTSSNATASVMDYLDLYDEIRESLEWGRYDEAALVFAYSGGKVDLAKKNGSIFLYCTDEHRELNAMCNAYDTGSTPSEVALSLIENYDSSYEISNKRFDQDYWGFF